jgi:hypothetical protein
MLETQSSRYVHEFCWPEDIDFETHLGDEVKEFDGRINNVHTYRGTHHVIVMWPTKEKAEACVRKYYTEAACDPQMLAEMIADIHQA